MRLTFRTLEDDRPRRPRRIVQQRLRPGACRIVHVQRHRRRLQRRQPVMVVLRVKALDMADRVHRAPHVEPVRPPADRVVIGHRPAIRPRHHVHPVRPQHMQLARQRTARPRIPHRLQIAVPAQHQLTVQRLQKLRPSLPRIRPRHQRRHRMRVIAPLAVLHDQWQRRRRLGDQLHRPEPHRIAKESRLRQAHHVARAPRDPPRRSPGHHPPRRRRLALGHCRFRPPEDVPRHATNPSPSAQDAASGPEPLAVIRFLSDRSARRAT